MPSDPPKNCASRGARRSGSAASSTPASFKSGIGPAPVARTMPRRPPFVTNPSSSARFLRYGAAMTEKTTRLNVLLVEDDPTVAAAVTEVLELNGYDVSQAG